MKFSLKKTSRILRTIFVTSLFFFILSSIIAYARGYRFNLQESRIVSTGIIAVSATPKAAAVYVNGELQGATDVNLTLPYGRYRVEVKKEGYSEWSKTISLKGETVMTLDAKLFSKNPTLTPLTNVGISKALSLGGSDTIILVSQTGDAATDGIYAYDAGKRSLTIFAPLSPLVLKSTLPPEVDLNSMTMEEDPTYSQAIITFQTSSEPITYLIPLDRTTTELVQVTHSKEKNIIAQWDLERDQEAQKIMESLPKQIRQTAFDSMIYVSLSPNKKKLLYVAKNDTILPIVLHPPLIGSNQTPETRILHKGQIYIYDIKEDKNYLQQGIVDADLIHDEFEVPTPSPTPADESTISATGSMQTHLTSHAVSRSVFSQLVWYPTSDYVSVKELNQISVMEYDGQNKKAVYAGPFDPQFYTINSSGNLIVVIDLNPSNNQYGDLYSVSLQ